VAQQSETQFEDMMGISGATNPLVEDEKFDFNEFLAKR